MSGGKRSDKNVTVNFAIGGYGGTKPQAMDNVATNSGSGTAYGIPTLKMLNPELYKEMEKQIWKTKVGQEIILQSHLAGGSRNTI